MGDGEVRYKCSVATGVGSDTGGTDLAPEVLGRMLQTSLTTMDRHFDSLVKVSYGVLEPQFAAEHLVDELSFAQNLVADMLSRLPTGGRDSWGGRLVDGLRELLSRMDTTPTSTRSQ